MGSLPAPSVSAILSAVSASDKMYFKLSRRLLPHRPRLPSPRPLLGRGSLTSLPQEEDGRRTLKIKVASSFPKPRRVYRSFQSGHAGWAQEPLRQTVCAQRVRGDHLLDISAASPAHFILNPIPLWL